jgi:predicted nucleotidyltransferase
LIEAAPLLVRIVEAWHPYQIWLFGSRARGEANEESDWDLLVVVPDEVSDEEIDPLAVWNVRRESRVRADVIACQKRDCLDSLDTTNTLSYEASKRGVLIYQG